MCVVVVQFDVGLPDGTRITGEDLSLEVIVQSGYSGRQMSKVTEVVPANGIVAIGLTIPESDKYSYSSPSLRTKVILNRERSLFYARQNRKKFGVVVLRVWADCYFTTSAK